MMRTPSPSKIFWIVLVLAAGLIVINGMITQVSLGDESHHYHFAQNIYWSGKRVAFDPLYGSGNPPGFFYNDPPFWHLILAFVWKITGGISQVVAQAYHVLFFILLVWLTSLLAKEVIGEEKKWFPALIIATVPMVVSFSTLFYMDIPVTALSVLSFYLILKRRYIEAGVVSGVMYFTKLNGAFFFPGFLFMILWSERKKFWGLVRSTSFFVIPICMIYFPDQIWRKSNIALDTIGWANVSARLSLFMILKGIEWKEYLNSYLTNPVDLIKYFGVAFFFLLFFHPFHFRQWNKKHAVLLVPVISYLGLFIIIFGVVSDIRYLLPVLPYLIILCTVSVFLLRKRWQFILVGMCVIQFVSTTYYVHEYRQISSEVREGFEYIRKNIPQKALILYPEENLLIYTQHRMIWSNALFFRDGQQLSLGSVFWPKDPEEMARNLEACQFDHILIKKSRIYDDRREHHLGGYPKSFVEKFSNLEGWKKVFENPGVVLWRKD